MTNDKLAATFHRAGMLSGDYKDRVKLFELLPELSHLPWDTDFKIFKEWLPIKDCYEYAVIWREGDKKFKLYFYLYTDYVDEPVEVKNMYLMVKHGRGQEYVRTSN